MLMNFVLLNVNNWTFVNFGMPMNPLLKTWIIVMISVASLCFIISEITQNYSQVDKLWSIMPIVYAIIALINTPSSPRLWIVTILVALWGIRLSYNFGRKGGYNIFPWKGEEDYRWKITKNKSVFNKPWKFTLFNLFFISFYQHFLILLFSSPIILIALNSNKQLNILDIIAAFLVLTFLIIETIADNQLFEFHQIKKKQNLTNQKYEQSLENGFMSEGIWAYSRHPNFVGEQGFWVSFYIFGVAASQNLINFTILGSVLLIILFIGSSTLTETISASKYPNYKEYQQLVPRYLPLFKKKK